MNGSKPGYVSSSFWRRPRCTEDLTFDRLLGGILVGTEALAVVFCVLFYNKVFEKAVCVYRSQYETARAVCVGSSRLGGEMWSNLVHKRPKSIRYAVAVFV
jgi:hypothetical protein